MIFGAQKECCYTNSPKNHFLVNNNVFSGIAKKLKDNSVTIDTLYVSNISQYMVSPENKNAFESTVKHLHTRETKLIHCGDHLRQNSIVRR